ncbi:hypothetical protein AYI68_g2941 [Smittium mucronatum]|uniref:Uncharacterized protein n=1 Tax=Smittium mucronatum TaxID=133383 RepID=A0A1R0H1B8_9FUNG|nr:hypothetical protein AYI68_g2941 [Smittium mucronatum]
MVVRTENEMTEKFDYKCVSRQRCPTTQILFDFFINDIYERIEGVYVPSLGKSIPGLLFALRCGGNRKYTGVSPKFIKLAF